MTDVAPADVPAQPKAPAGVNVLNPQGELVSIPSDRVQDAVNVGYTVPTEQDITRHINEKTYGTTEQRIKTFAEGVLEGASFGTSLAIERAFGVNPQDILARRETNSGTHALGQATGLVGSMLIPGAGEANVLKAAGEGGAELLGLGAAKLAADATMKQTAKYIGQKAASAAVKGAIESAIFQGTDEVAKTIMGDPNAGIGSAVANMGVAGLIGGGFGGVLGGTGALWDATAGKKLAGFLDTVAHHAEAPTDVLPDATPLDPNYLQLQNIKNQMGSFKHNAAEIDAAAKRLGVKPTVGMLSGSKTAQDLENVLASSGHTVPGHAIANEVDQVFTGIKKAGEGLLSEATDKSAAAVGKELKNGIVDSLEKELSPLEASYEQLKEHFKAMDIEDTLKNRAARTIKNHELNGATKELSALADNLTERIGAIRNVNDLKVQRTVLNAEIDRAMRAGGPEIGLLMEAKNAMNTMRSEAIESASRRAMSGETSAISKETIKQIADTDAAYSAYKAKLQNLGVEAGLGNINNARAMLNRFKKISDESFASRVFDPKDINQLSFFKQHFPEQFDLARKYKLADIYEKSISNAMGKNSSFDVGKFLGQTGPGKISEEASALLFGSGAQTLKDIQTLYRAVPGVVNPSGTGKFMALKNLFTVHGALENASDAVKYGVLKMWPHIEQLAAAGGDSKASFLAAVKAATSGTETSPRAFASTVKFIETAMKGETMIQRAAKNVFDASSVVAPTALINNMKDTERLDKKLMDLKADPSSLINTGGELAHYMPDHATSAAQSAMSVVNYLNSIRPNTDPKAPLDSPIQLSNAQKAEYARALQIAQAPLTVMGSIKAGTITPNDVKHLTTMYPALYTMMSQKLMAQMIGHQSKGKLIPYKTKLGMSLFMGQPLDSTMTPQSIMAAQMRIGAQMPSQMGHAPGAPSASSMKGMTKMIGAYATPGQSREMRRGGSF